MGGRAAQEIAIRLEAAHILGHDQQVRQRDLDAVGRVRDHDPLVLILRPHPPQQASGRPGSATPEHLQDIRDRDDNISGHDLQP